MVETIWPLERLVNKGPELLPALVGRRSALSFDPRPLEIPVLRALFEAARLAPSSFNEQPWRYWVGTGENPEFRERLRDLLVEGNNWAKAAPVLILSGAHEHYAHNGGENGAAAHDLGAANLALMLQAQELGLASHAMGGFSHDDARELMEDSDITPYAMIAVGYPGDPERLSESLRERDQNRSTRRPLNEFVLAGPTALTIS